MLRRVLVTLRRIQVTLRRSLATTRMLVPRTVPRTVQLTMALRLLELKMLLRVMDRLRLRVRMSRAREMPVMKTPLRRMILRSMGSQEMMPKVCLVYSELEVIF